MKKIFSIFFALLLCLSMAFSCAMPCAFAAGNTVSDIEKLIDEIIGFKLKETGSPSVQAMINSSLSENAGVSSEWYVLALRRYEKGYDFSAYSKALKSYVSTEDISNAVTREKYALVFAAINYNTEIISKTLDNSIGELGVMSWVYGLQLLNNGYKSSKHSLSSVTNQLLSMQFEDGGWALGGNSADVDVTAMVVQALAPQYSAANVKKSIDKALSLLSSRQLPSGGFKSYGKENPESSAQVITALCALKINPLSDKRFVKNGKTPLDGMLKFRLPDKSYIHLEGGSYNHNATVQSLFSLVSLWRYMRGLSPIYILRKTDPITQEGTSAQKTTVQTSVKPSAQQENQTASASNNKLTTSADVTGTSPTETTKISAESTSQAENGVTQKKEDVTEAFAVEENEASSLHSEDKSEALTNSGQSDKSQSGKKGFEGYKLWAVAAIWVIALAVCVGFFALKKRNKFNFLAIILVAALLTAAVAFTDFQKTEDYYGSEKNDISQSDEVQTINVSISISCDEIAGKSDKEYVPQDGKILETEGYSLPKGATVYDLLVAAAKKHRIQIENDAQTGNSYENAYIRGINHIYEFDFGDMAGWIFRVNGEFASLGCGQYELSDSDKVEWIYSLTPPSDVVN